MTTSDDSTEPEDSELHAQLVDEFYRSHVHMVLYARTGSGTWSHEDELKSFTVYLDEPIVCVNDECCGWRQARITRSYAEGESIDFADVVSERVDLPAHQPPYFRAALIDGTWEAELDLQRPVAPAMLAAGAEFLTAAEQAYDRRALRVFVENAFHAAETFARIELSSYPLTADELEGSRKHRHVQSVYDIWANLGNTDQRFPRLLRELADLRTSATYVNEPFELDFEKAATQLDALRALAAHARGIAENPALRKTPVNVVALRAINAREIVRRSDISLRRPKKRRED